MASPSDPSDSTDQEGWTRTLTPEQVADVGFTTGRRGFDEAEVRDFLGFVAGDYESALDEAARASEQLAQLHQEYEKALDSWRSAASAHQVAQTAVKDAVARQGQAEGRAGTLERERDEARSKANEIQAALNGARKELENTKAALVKAQEALSSEDDDEYSKLGDQVAVLLRSAAMAADSVRAEAELYAAQTRGEADDYRSQLRRDAEAALAEATQEASEVRADADQYGTDVRYQTDMAAMRVESDAEEKARRQIDAADKEAVSLVSTAEETVAQLRETEAELRRRLELLSDWINQALVMQSGDAEETIPAGDPPANP